MLILPRPDYVIDWTETPEQIRRRWRRARIADGAFVVAVLLGSAATVVGLSAWILAATGGR